MQHAKYTLIVRNFGQRLDLKVFIKLFKNFFTLGNFFTFVTPWKHQKTVGFLTPAGNYMFNVNNRNTRLGVKFGRQRRSGVFFVNFKHISSLILMFLGAVR